MYVTIVKSPKLEEAIMFVVPKYTTRWKDIGPMLNLADDLLSAIEQAYPTNPDWCCDKMLQRWLEVDNQATWKQLNDAIDFLDDPSGRVMYVYIYLLNVAKSFVIGM